MIQVSEWFKTEMVKQTLNVLRKFIYDDIDESARVESFGSISRASDAIVSGGASLSLINTDKHWNKFITDKTNLRRTAKLQIGLTNGAGEEWIDILTGWGDDPEFSEAMISLLIRDKFAGLLEKKLGSEEVPLDYYSSAYNPADLAWSVLTVHGGFDSTASVANVDIDYASWSAWKTACSTGNFSLKARFMGETIREALELIRDLTNSDIYVSGEGKIKFFRFTQAAPPEESYLFDSDKVVDLSVKLDSDKIVNYLRVYYNRRVITELVTNGDMELDANWSDMWSPSDNSRSSTQKYGGSFSRKIISGGATKGAYQDVATIAGLEYELTGRIYVAAGDACLGIGTKEQVFGYSGTGGQYYDIGNIIHTARFYTAIGVTGALKSISAYIKAFGNVGRVKCALYKCPNGTVVDLIGTTEEKAILSTQDGWLTFNFSGAPEIEANTPYELAVWADTAGIKIGYASISGEYADAAQAYGDWPDPLDRGGLTSGTRLQLFARYVPTNGAKFSGRATEATWEQVSLTFGAVGSTTRVFFCSDLQPISTFYVDDMSVKWKGPEYFEGTYLREDAASQQEPPNGYGLCAKIVAGTVVWHATLASVTSYADRHVAVFKEPLEVVLFTSFMMGMITEIGDIIRITDEFFGYSNNYFRVHKIANLNLDDATIRLEAGDFDDIAVPSYSTPLVHDKSSEGENKIENADTNIFTSLNAAAYHRVAQKITLTGETLVSASFWVNRVANPSGTVYARVRKVSDDSIIETSSRQIDVMTISSEESWETFPFTCAPNEEVRICLEFNGGDGNNRVNVYFDSRNPIIGNAQKYYEDEWSDAWGPGYDQTIKILFGPYAAANTVDDNNNTYWVPEPPNESGAWISWDMGSDKYMDGCRIYWGSEVAYRPTEYKIYTSPDDLEWTEVVHETEAAPASAWKEYSWSGKVTRYFKLVVITHGASGIKVYESDGKCI